MPESADPTTYSLTTSFPFLLARAGVRMGELFSSELREHGMTLPMYRTLAALWERDGQRLSELSTMIGIELSTLSRLVSQLKQQGWVSRQRPVGDERSVRLSLTARGRERVASLIPRARHYEALATASFKTEDVARLKDALRRILANLGEASDTPASRNPEQEPRSASTIAGSGASVRTRATANARDVSPAREPTSG